MNLLDRAKARNPLPQGTLAVGAGLLVAGVTAYGFLVISARVLGPERYSALSVLWALAFLAAPGLFLPLEQEVGRALSARRALGDGGRPVVIKAARAGGTLALLLIAASIIGSRPLLDRLFDRDVLLLAGLALTMVGYFAEHLARGTLSGSGRFRPYGIVVGAEGAVRLLVCVILALAGVKTAGPYGLAIGLAPFAAVATVAIGPRRQRGLLTPGPDASWSELSTNLGYLLAGSLLAQALMNAGPLAVKLLAPPSEQAAAGRFLAGLVIARVPVFLFQAVQAALLPKLSGLAAAGRHADFRRGLKRLLVAVMTIGSAGTLGAFLIGPWVVRALFGKEFTLGRADITYLAGASASFMVAVALAQGLIALHGHRPAALAWLGGVTVFVAVVVSRSGLFLRVEQAFLAGSIATAASMAALLVSRISREQSSAEELTRAAQEFPVEP